jgi:hypothetical protein
MVRQHYVEAFSLRCSEIFGEASVYVRREEKRAGGIGEVNEKGGGS